MKFWTFQHKHSLDAIASRGFYRPNFNDKYYERNCLRKNSYSYIKRMYQIANPEPIQARACQGLVFGLIECDGNKINTYDEYIKVISSGICGISSSVENHYLLELDIDIDENQLMPTDFYRFCDLIHYLDIKHEDSKELNGIDLDKHVAIQNLFKPNNDDGTYELKQAHYHEITRKMITNIYPAVEIEYGYNNLLYSTCKDIEYYKDKLIIKR